MPCRSRNLNFALLRNIENSTSNFNPAYPHPKLIDDLLPSFLPAYLQPKLIDSLLPSFLVSILDLDFDSPVHKIKLAWRPEVVEILQTG